MCFLSSPADDAPAPPKLQASPTIADLLREQGHLHQHAGNVARMVEGFRESDGSYTPAVRRMTLAATRNALDAYAKTLDTLESEVLPVRALPHPVKTFGRRLPAVVSPEAVS